MPVADPLDDQLCFAFYAAGLAIGRTLKPQLDALGLTYPQYLVLHALWERDGLGIGAIAERLGLEPSTVTPLVKRLEATGLVGRARTGADGRHVTVRLTPEGVAMRERCGGLAGSLLRRSGLTPGEAAALNRQVRALRLALGPAKP